MIPSEFYEPSGDLSSGDSANGDGPVVSYGSGLGAGWHSHRIGEVTLALPEGDGRFSITITAYINTPVPVSLPSWPRALSLRPDLQQRVN